MDRFDQLSAAEIDELLRGQPLADHPDLRPVADLAAALRSSAHAEPAPVMGYALRRAIAHRAAPPPSVRGRRRRLDAVAASVALVALGAVGAAGALPAPLQDAVSNAGEVVGVQLPGADDHAQGAPGVPVAARLLGEPEDEGTEPKAAAPPDVTPGGATPAEPGTSGDKEPATPGVPPADAAGPDSGADDGGPAGNVRTPGPGNAADRAQVPDDPGPSSDPVATADPATDAAEDGATDAAEDGETTDKDPRPVRPPLS